MMKRLLLALLLVGFAVTAFAQVLSPGSQVVNQVASSERVCSQTTAGKACASWAPLQYPTVLFQIVGTFTGTLTFEGTADGATWFTIRVVNFGTAAGATTATSTGQFSAINNGLVGIRVRASAWTSGTASITVTRGTATALYSVS